MEVYKSADPATQHTAAGIPEISSMNTTFQFTTAEIAQLRKLATQVAEIAADPIQNHKSALWKKHNDLKTTEPLVFIDPENGWNECIPPDTLLCQDPLARVWEMVLQKEIYWFKVMKDDRVIDDYFDIPHVYTDTGWGVPIIKHGGENGGSFKMQQAIEAYETDFPKIQYPMPVIDWKKSGQVLELAHAVFDGILNVRQKTPWWWTLGMTWDFINLRGLQPLMLDTILNPDWVHRLMSLLCEGQLAKLDFLEKHNLLSTNTGNTYVGSGGFGYTDDLNNAPMNLSTMDMWGFVESQETVGISPAAYGEFIFPYHKKIAERFGLNCYGCCEPTDIRWDYVKQLPRLRRVSYSPWANWESAPELLGQRYITSLKPMPTALAMPNMDEDLVRKDVRRALDATRNCVVEIIMKDNNTLGNCPRNASRWVEIVREEIEKT